MESEMKTNDEVPAPALITPDVDSEAPSANTQEETKNKVKIFKPFPRFSASPHSAPSSSAIKFREISPEVTFVEFISSSASFFRVKKSSIRALESDILRVFPHNVMPANAAAWFMSRLHQPGRPSSYQVLLPILKHYPKKFQVDLRSRTVKFLEHYDRDVSRKMLQFLVHQGLFSYFSHKVDEHGVYFFDPLFYQRQEPFCTNLKMFTNRRQLRGASLVKSYFQKLEDQFCFTEHSQYLVSISKSPVTTITNQIGVVFSMKNKEFGLIKFRHEDHSSEVALFNIRQLFKDGYKLENDPLTMPHITFDGFKIPNSEGKDYSWYAVLVWHGKKPNPRFCATLKDLSYDSQQPFQNRAMTYNELAGITIKVQEHKTEAENMPCQIDDGMKVGEVKQIRRNGAVVVMPKENDLEAFIPGWSFKLVGKSDYHLNTTQGLTLSRGDLLAFYLDASSKPEPYQGFGYNVMILKRASSENAAESKSGAEKSNKSKRRTRRSSKRLTSGGESTAVSSSEKSDDEGKTAKGKGKKSQRRYGDRRRSKVSESSDAVRRRRRSSSLRQSFVDFLLTKDIIEEEAYNSDNDPTFIPPPMYDIDFDYDEYSDGEISKEEEEAILKEKDNDVDEAEIPPPDYKVPINDVASSGDSIPKKSQVPRWAEALIKGDVLPDEEDRDFVPRPGLLLAMNIELPVKEEKEDEEKEEIEAGEEKDQAEEDSEIPDDEVENLMKESEIDLEILVKEFSVKCEDHPAEDVDVPEAAAPTGAQIAAQ